MESKEIAQVTTGIQWYLNLVELLIDVKWRDVSPPLLFYTKISGYTQNKGDCPL